MQRFPFMKLTITRLGQRSKETVTDEQILASQAALRSLGLIPYGATVKEEAGSAIIIPEGTHRSGLGIPLREGDKGVRFKVHGTGKLMIRVGDQAQGTDGKYATIRVPTKENGNKRPSR